MIAKLLLDSPKDKKFSNQYITFWIGNKFFGINILDVKEIYADVNVTPIYHATEDIRGYINIRGEIYLVADLRRLLGLQKGFINVEEKLIIFKEYLFESFGVVIDKVSDVISIDEQEIETFATDDEDHDGTLWNNEHKIIDGIFKLDSGLILILNAKNIMQVIFTTSKQNQPL